MSSFNVFSRSSNSQQNGSYFLEKDFSNELNTVFTAPRGVSVKWTLRPRARMPPPILKEENRYGLNLVFQAAQNGGLVFQSFHDINIPMDWMRIPDVRLSEMLLRSRVAAYRHVFPACTMALVGRNSI